MVTGSDDNTIRLWDAGMRQSSQQCAESDHPALSVEHRSIEATTTMKSYTWNNHFIRFSSTSIHALCDTYELIEGASHDDHSLTPSTPFFLNYDNGWVVGPKQRLLFWVPLASRRLFYSPRTAMVIPRGGPELDLSCMAHGQHWQKCREG
ncbi:uncharacterized protein EDB93DRAFT_1119911 [Suillus bovinus]|uniref:uncharacterized protein n=1 Tax=Suillus bovinus TaxID=48563 RepID=UPI001B86A2D0|nr:uncharacterized protein EDB93DRAFT_1119911 [Suillus bovinus]KAG2158706.1 hypothetical protein EDB93DRAFT_1119911 [Suillus bovinus]